MVVSYWEEPARNPLVTLYINLRLFSREAETTERHLVLSIHTLFVSFTVILVHLVIHADRLREKIFPRIQSRELCLINQQNFKYHWQCHKKRCEKLIDQEVIQLGYYSSTNKLHRMRGPTVRWSWSSIESKLNELACTNSFNSISLLSHVYKLFSRVITNRLASRLDDF